MVHINNDADLSVYLIVILIQSISINIVMKFKKLVYNLLT